MQNLHHLLATLRSHPRSNRNRGDNCEEKENKSSVLWVLSSMMLSYSVFCFFMVSTGHIPMPPNHILGPMGHHSRHFSGIWTPDMWLHCSDAGTKWQDGQRVSTRIKSKPLEWWRGERMLYGRVHSCKLYVLLFLQPCLHEHGGEGTRGLWVVFLGAFH